MRLILASLFCLYCSTANSQILQAHLADINTKEKISDAFLFISNSTQSTVSDSNGQFELDRTSLPSSDIVITHINYETKYLSLNEIRKTGDTIYMSPVLHEIDEVVLQSKKSKKRKKWLERFTRSILGATKNGTKTKLVNPEVVLFHESNGLLKTQTSDYLKFKNENLGYNVWLFLDDYTLEKDNDVMYSGKVFFEDIEKLEPEHLANRNAVYEESSRKFFKDFAAGTYDSLQFRISIATLENDGFFHYVGDMKRNKLLTDLAGKDLYELKFRQFLRIENRAISTKQENYRSLKGFGRPGFGDMARDNSVKDNRDRSDHAVSYFSSRSNQILINEDGIIQNQKDIEEYGYWSEIRLADRLPDDFEYVPLKQQ